MIDLQNLLILAQSKAAPKPAGNPAASEEIVPELGNRLQQVMEGWQSNNTNLFPVHQLGYILLAFMVIMISLALWKWYKNRPIDPTPSLLFRQMARELRLGLLDRWLLLRICHEQHLPSPLTLLLSRATLLHYTQQYTKDLSAIRGPMVTARANRIVEMLFGSEKQAHKDTMAALKQANFQPVLASEGHVSNDAQATAPEAADEAGDIQANAAV